MKLFRTIILLLYTLNLTESISQDSSCIGNDLYKRGELQAIDYIKDFQMKNPEVNIEYFLCSDKYNFRSPEYFNLIDSLSVISGIKIVNCNFHATSSCFEIGYRQTMGLTKKNIKRPDSLLKIIEEKANFLLIEKRKKQEFIDLNFCDSNDLLINKKYKKLGLFDFYNKEHDPEKKYYFVQDGGSVLSFNLYVSKYGRVKRIEFYHFAPRFAESDDSISDIKETLSKIFIGKKLFKSCKLGKVRKKMIFKLSLSFKWK